MPIRHGYITPDEIPEATICRVLFIPDDPIFRAAIDGALTELAYPFTWEQVGAVTVDEAAAAAQVMLDSYFAQNCEAAFMLGIDEFIHELSQGTNGGGITANTNTAIPFNTVLTEQGGNVALDGNNNFTIQPGQYLIDMEHVCGSGTADNRAWFEDASDATLYIQGATFEAGTAGRFYHHVRGYFNVPTTIDTKFRCRSTVTLANVYFGSPYNQAGFTERYGFVRFTRLGDPA